MKSSDPNKPGTSLSNKLPSSTSFSWSYFFAFGCFLLAATILFILWGYDARDALVWQAVSPQPIRHWGGHYGVYIAIILYQWMGETAVSLPIGLAMAALGSILHFRQWIQGLWLLILSSLWAACFFTFTQPALWISARSPARGGILGIYLLSCLDYSPIIQKVILYTIGIGIMMWGCLLFTTPDYPPAEKNSKKFSKHSTKGLFFL